MNKKLETPVILINFKAYLEATGKKAVELAKKVQKVNVETGCCFGIVPQMADIRHVVDNVSLPVFAQHVDSVRAGSYTGHLLIESVKEAGAVGTLINHSEKQLKLSEINQTIERLREKNLISVVCASNPTLSAAVAALKPDVIAIEPPELIGSGIAVSSAKPELITNTISSVESVNPEVIILCGAGITSGKDVSAALSLGTKGVLVASGIVKASNHYKILREFAKATKP